MYDDIIQWKSSRRKERGRLQSHVTEGKGVTLQARVITLRYSNNYLRFSINLTLQQYLHVVNKKKDENITCSSINVCS